MTLTRNGYEPVMVKDGQEALEVLGGQRIDLVISDVAMPGMNGYQLFEEVRSRGRQEVYYALLPFVFLTARGITVLLAVLNTGWAGPFLTPDQTQTPALACYLDQ